MSGSASRIDDPSGRMNRSPPLHAATTSGNMSPSVRGGPHAEGDPRRALAFARPVLGSRPRPRHRRAGREARRRPWRARPHRAARVGPPRGPLPRGHERRRRLPLDPRQWLRPGRASATSPGLSGSCAATRPRRRHRRRPRRRGSETDVPSYARSRNLDSAARTNRERTCSLARRRSAGGSEVSASTRP